ncbi:hypothetical protein FIBSPDRAFT_996931 [Athelia psychrophila]|uniref:Uncharacterized protein n=1 Tax=Athelia psychrophila TaxID=1759441 RepID=A0A166RD22_9AGAM|nr:hypothetical protein FIBSPDRAFT_996931 [Fibularhizoctonia sp. CBS 109695]
MHSFQSAIRAAMDINDAGIDSPRGSPVMPPNIEVSRLSSPFPSPPPPSSLVSLPPAPSESDWTGGSSDWSTSDAESEHGDPPIDEPSTVNKKKRKRKRKQVPGDGAIKKALTSTRFTRKHLVSLKEKHIWCLNDENHIIAVLAGRPVAKPGELDDWPEVVAGLEAQEDYDHYCGPLPAKDFGVSHGGGQKLMQFLASTPSFLKSGSLRNDSAINNFRANPHVKCAVGFASSGFACFAPKMCKRYSDYFTRLCKYDPVKG